MQTIHKASKQELDRLAERYGISKTLLPDPEGPDVEFMQYQIGERSVTTGKAILGNDMQLATEYVFHDHIAGRDILMRRVVGTRPGKDANGNLIEIENVEPIWFNKGHIKINRKRQYLDLLFLWFHPHNASNPLRPAGSMNVFKKAAEAPKIDYKLIERQNNLVEMCQGIVNKMEWKEVKDCLNRFADLYPGKLPNLQEVEKIAKDNQTAPYVVGRQELKMFVGKFPMEFLKDSPREEDRMRHLVKEAMEMELIDYNVTDREWRFVSSNRMICQVELTDTAEDGIVKFLVAGDEKAQKFIVKVSARIEKGEPLDEEDLTEDPAEAYVPLPFNAPPSFKSRNKK